MKSNPNLVLAWLWIRPGFVSGLMPRVSRAIKHFKAMSVRLSQTMLTQVLSINTPPASRVILNQIMKTKFQIILAMAVALGAFRATGLAAQETNAAPARVGVYDSRAVAFAWFWNDAHQRQLKELSQQARAAKTAGDTNRFQTLAADLRCQQEEIHREGFSTAPPVGALDQIKDRIPEIERQAGVTALVSKWDAAALKQFPRAETVDVTGQLVREFKPTEKQLKTISELEKNKPLPLEECDELIRKGKI